MMILFLRMRARSCAAVPLANSRPKHNARSSTHAWRLEVLTTIWLAMIIFSSSTVCALPTATAGTTSSPSTNSPSVRQQLQHAAAAGPAAAAVSSEAQQSSGHGRSLKQMGAYDPYGIGYYDPYQAGVTPGLINVDLNRETGLHVDVGTVAMDISADKNYYGLGVGNLFGIGAAKDRGWNMQVGGGNIMDVSVTKDAGLGLWLLNGLANIQIGPDGRGWETGHIAAQGVPGQAATAAAAGQPGQGVTSVVVDESQAQQVEGGDSTVAAAAAGDVADVHVASEAPAAAVEEPIITEEPINMALTSAAAAAAAEPQPQPQPAAVQAAAARSRLAARSRPKTYVQPRPTVITTNDDSVWSGAAEVPASAAQGAYAAPARAAGAAAPTSDPAAPLVEAAVVAPYSAAFGYEGAVGAQQPAENFPAAAAAAGGGAAPRRACEGGVMVAAAGNKYKCKYRRPKQAVTGLQYSG